MNVLEGLLGSDLGISLYATSHNLYWSRDGADLIRAFKDSRDPYTKFKGSKSSDGYLLLQADTDKYLSLNGSDRVMRSNKYPYDDWCKFTVYDVGNGEIALQGHDNRFVSVWGGNNLQGLKEGIDQYCRFRPGFGSKVDPTYEITKVEVHDDLSDKSHWQPDSVDQTIFINRSPQEFESEVKMEYAKNDVETTTWQRTWGAGVKLSHKAGIPGISQAAFEMEITTGGGQGGSSTTSKANTFVRSVSVKAAPGKKTVVSLITQKKEGVKVNFTATIVRTLSDNTKKEFQEQGTWTGVVYRSASIHLEEHGLDD